MPWRQVLVALICTSLTVQSSPCSWVEVLSSWSQGYKAVVKLQMEETVDHWSVDVEFSESVINFEAWKGHVNKISDTNYTVSNTCYNNMVYSCQCFELPYLVRHEPIWEGNTTFKFNGELVPTCEPPSCDDSLSGADNTTSTSQPAESLTTSELTENLNLVGNILNDLSSLGLKRYKRQANGFTKDENELLNTLAEYTTYLKNECSTKSGSCQSKTLAAYGSKLNSIFQKVKNSGGISSGFVDAFKEKYEQLKEATKTAVDNQAENSCKANGKPCIFPFKDDAGKEHNNCADYKGKYFWCATRVNSKGKYVSWERCPDDGRCPLPKNEKTTTTTTTTTPPPPPTKQPQQGVACMAGSKPCVFPFKDTDGTEYNECADYKGRYFWCATAVNSKGTFTNWGKCTECEDPNTTPSTPEDCSCTDYINKKGYGDCQKGHPDFSNAGICYVKLPSTCSDLRESKTDLGKMASAEACKKDCSCTDYINKKGYGQCKKGHPDFNDAGICYVKLPSTCSDLKESKTDPGKMASAEACKKGSCLANGNPCIFPFKDDDGTSYNGCPKYEDRYYWCATSLKTNGVFKVWEHCPEDGSCPLLNNDDSSTPAALPKPTTKPSESPEITTEDTCCETLTISSTGGTAEHQGARLGTYKKDGEHNNKPVYMQQDGSKILFFSEFDGFEWVVGSSVNSGGGLRSKPGSSESCPSDVKQWEYYIPGTTNTWVVDSTAEVKCDGENNCGIDTKLDSTRFIAELNTAYIFKAIDKTDDPTPEYKTQVFDVVTFDKENKPRRVIEERSRTKQNEADLVTLFLTTKEKECNKLTFKDASKENGGYYPVFISSSFDELSEPIEKFIADAQNLKTFFNGEIPKLCGTWLRMENKVAKLRENEMKFLFNFMYNNNGRIFEPSGKKCCKHNEDTITSIKKSEIFDTSESLYFEKETVNAFESDKFAILTVIRNSSLNRKAVGFIETSFSTMEHKCSAATAEDIVPSSNTVFFNENEKEGIVIIRVKQDDITDDNECLVVRLIEENRMRGPKPRKTYAIVTTSEDTEMKTRMGNERDLSFIFFAFSLSIETDQQKLSRPFISSSLTSHQFKDAKTLIPFDIISIDAGGNLVYKSKPLGAPDPLKIPTFYYEIPWKNRLKHVIHEIGHLIMEYGLQESKLIDHFVYLKVDYILYQICLDNTPRIGNLYTRTIGCFFNEVISEDDCKKLVLLDKAKRKGNAQYGSQSYTHFKDILTTDEYNGHLLLSNDEVVLNALKQLYAFDGGIDNFYFAFALPSEISSTDIMELCGKALFAAEMAMAMTVEIIRFPDILPTTLRLINNMEKGPYAFLTDIHPMMQGESWMFRLNDFIIPGNLKMTQVGFWPYIDMWDTYLNQDTDKIYVTKGKFNEVLYKKIMTILADFAGNDQYLIQGLFTQEEINSVTEDPDKNIFSRVQSSLAPASDQSAAASLPAVPA